MADKQSTLRVPAPASDLLVSATAAQAELSTALLLERLHDVRQAPVLMGILNVTPDSFSDGGRHLRLRDAITHAKAMVDAGADILDVGGESTRPGSITPPVQVELDRVVPTVRAITEELGVPVSVDTSSPEVMEQAVGAGATIVNDVRALTKPQALTTAARLNAVVCLMHMQGEPDTMQLDPHYQHVVADVRLFLQSRRDAAIAAGIPNRRIVLDPGFGFGKTLAHNVALLRRLDALVDLGCPVMIGVSRKRMIGDLTGKPVNDRLQGSAAAAALAVRAGARMVRTHDVAETRDAVAVAHALTDAGVLDSGHLEAKT